MIEAEGVAVPLAELRIVRADHGVCVRLGSRLNAPRVDLVEHVLGALGGLGVREGVAVIVEGGEVPLLDGGAALFVEALRSLGLAETAPRGIVARAFSAVIDGSTYRLEPGAVSRVAVDIAFSHPAVGAQSAELTHDPDDFARRIAPARTFGFAADWPVLLAAGRARGVDPRSVLVFDEEGVHPSSQPAAREEPARHKLLDLLGDLTLFGGPFRGTFHAVRPGHARTHAFLRSALAAGALVVAP